MRIRAHFPPSAPALLSPAANRCVSYAAASTLQALADVLPPCFSPWAACIPRSTPSLCRGSAFGRCAYSSRYRFFPYRSPTCAFFESLCDLGGDYTKKGERTACAHLLFYSCSSTFPSIFGRSQAPRVRADLATAAPSTTSTITLGSTIR